MLIKNVFITGGKTVMPLFMLILFVLCAFCIWKYIIQNENKLSFVMENNRFDLTRLFKMIEPETDFDRPVFQSIVNMEDVRRFDDVSKLLFEKEIYKKELNVATQIQYEFLNKMPTQTQSQINEFDLGEWSIFWGYKSQSLEYYVSRYGVFYTHVDGAGVEHKFEIKDAM